MSYQGRQALQVGVVSRPRSTPREAALDRVETCQLQAVNEIGIGGPRLHGLMVPVQPRSKELQSDPEPLSNALQLLESWHQEALRAAGLNEGQLCAHIGNGKGGAYDQSQWTAARKTGNWPLGRQLAGCPDAYLDALAICFAVWRGFKVSQPTKADIAFEAAAAAAEAAAEAFRQLRTA